MKLDWIIVKESLPKTGDDYFVLFEDGEISIGFFDEDGWWPINVISTYDGAGVCVFDSKVIAWAYIPCI